MKRSATVIVILCLPLIGCGKKPVEAVSSESEVAPLLDLRPEAGRKSIGEDLTEVSRRQNLPGSEPPKPTNKGTVFAASRRPIVSRTDDGFVATLPAARNVPTPAYYRGRIYTGGYGTHEFHAISAETGKSDWSLRLSDDGPTAPVCKDGVCVFNTYSCTIFGVDAETGEHMWSWWLGSPQLATPVVSGDVVFTSYPDGSGPSGTGYVLAAFDLKTGTPHWRRWIDQEVNSTPVAFGGRVYVSTRRGTLYEFGASDGKVLSVHSNGAASPPVITPEGIHFRHQELGRENNMLVATAPVLPQLESTGARHRMVAPQPRPLVAAHRLVTVQDGVVIATDRKTGRRLWQHRLSGVAAAGVSAPLLYAGNSILLATSGGAVLRMKPDSGEVTTTYALGAGELASQPIVHDGWIYAGTRGGNLVGHNTGDRELTGWEMLGGGPDRQGTANPEAS